MEAHANESAGEARPGWAMGLSGWLGQVANLTAVALVCVLFWQAQQEQYRLAREDRGMYREELRRLEDAHERDRDRRDKVATEMARSLAELAGELRRMRRN